MRDEEDRPVHLAGRAEPRKSQPAFRLKLRQSSAVQERETSERERGRGERDEVDFQLNGNALPCTQSTTH